MSKEFISEYKPPMVEFSTKPTLIFLEKSHFPVYEYITPGVFIPQLKIFTGMINFDQFDAIANNQNGGGFPFEMMQCFSPKLSNAFPIEYRQSGKIVTPIPKYLYFKKLLVIEDVFDSGTSNELMKKHCPGVHLAVMSQKIGVPNQTSSDNITPLFLTINEWQAGAGMNIDFFGDLYFPMDSFRTYPGIVVRPPPEILKKYSN